MTPHLTISYASPTAPTPAATAPAGDEAAANPLGFLTALLDQLLAGANPPQETPETAVPAVATPTTAPVPAPESDPETETVTDILRVLLGKKDETADDAEAAPVMQMLASFGIEMPETPAKATPEALGAQLKQIGVALADTAPALAARLDTLAAVLTAPDVDPTFLDRLRAAVADSDPAPLDALLRQLQAPKPPALPAAPQIASTTKLDLPAALAQTSSEPAPAARQAPAPVEPSRDGAAKLALVAKPADAPPDPDAPRPEPLPARSDPALPPQPNATPASPAPLPRALPAAYQPAANPINMGQLAFEMVRQVHQGASRFTIRLDPPELGRVDVRLHVDASGAATARLTVDRAETLDLFQRDQRTLERALAQAGFDTTRTSLEFSLRQDGSAGFAGGQQQQQPAGAPRFSLDGESEPASPSPVLTLYRGTASAAGVNIFV